jgi:hypothetical protein
MGGEMKAFVLYRAEDETGISGEGIVAEGVEFLNSQCVLRWLTSPGSIGIYDNMDELLAIHGHNGKTEVIWYHDKHLLFDEALVDDGFELKYEKGRLS